MPDTQWKDEMGDLQSRKVPGGVLYRTGGGMSAPSMVFVPFSELERWIGNEITKMFTVNLPPMEHDGHPMEVTDSDHHPHGG